MSDPVEEAAKLPLSQRLEHSHWRVRSNAYEELAKKYNEALENTASIYHEYSGYFKKMMNDKNAAAMEKGLEPIFAFYDRYDHAAKFTASLAPLVIEKCLGARQGTKQRATELLLLMVEVDTTAESIVVALVEGATNKVPKVAIAAIQTMELVVKTFGVKVVPLKPIMAAFLSWFDHTNAEARAAAQTFTIELYRWVGGVILDKPIANLRQAQVTELQKAFADIVKGAAVPEKYLRCQLDQMQAAAAAGITAAPVVEEVDPYTMVEAVNLLSKITPELYEALHSKKWKDKKETLEAINKIADTPRLQSGEYGELVKNLKRLLGDANVFVVEESVKCLGFCASALRAEFTHFSKSTMGALLDKLKEKKDKVIAALQNTFDAYHPNCFAMADVMEDILTASKHKVPQVKRELLNWVKRALPKEKRPLLTKHLKAWCGLFMELMDDSDSPVRENAFECFGLLIGIMGERSLTGYLNQLDKVKEKRVREFIPTTPIAAPPSDSATSSAAPSSSIDVNAGVNLTAAPAAAKKAPATATTAAKKSTVAAPVARTSTAPAATSKLPAGPAASAKRTVSSSTAPTLSAAPKTTAVEVFSSEPRVNAVEAEARVADFIPENLVAQLGDKDWKQRLDAMSVVASVVERWDENSATQNAEALLLFLVVARPSFKEPNVQVLAKMTEVLKRLCTVPIGWHRNDVFVALSGIVERIHEAKLASVSIDFLNACGENTNLGIQFVFNAMYGVLKDQKAVKVVSESLAFLTTALSEFGGALIEIRNLVTFVKTVALENTNATIKATGIRLLCECYKQMGGTALLALLVDVKAQLLTTIKKEFEKVSAERAAAPTRGPNGPKPGEGFTPSASPSASSSAGADLPRVDISAQITAAIPGFTNTDWQKRQEAMAGLESVLIEVRRIQPKGLSALMAPLKARLADSNINLIPVALNLLGELAAASGPTIESHIKTVMPSILGCYSNAKVPVRVACSGCLDKWVEEVGLDPILAYLPTALGTPSGRAELLGWISTKLAYVKKGDVKVLLKPAFQCYQDKTKEVRTVAETTLIELARRLTAKLVEGECSKLAPAVLVQVRTLLKNNEAELKKPPPSAIPAPSARSKIPIPATLARAAELPASPSSDTSPRTSTEPEADNIAETSSAPIEAPSGPVLRNNKKSERELAMNDLPWLFDSSSVPTKLIDILREQMSVCVNPDLLDRLFSSEAKAHSTAIADLEASIDSSKEAVVDSLDVILKWCSWRLFHNNAAIVKRIVAFLEHLIGTLDIWGHPMTELEAASFIPIVVVRLPHLNDSLQSSLRSVLQSVEANFFAPSKIFKLFMQIERIWTGSQLTHASKVECLQYLSALLRRQSISVCDPSEAFKVVSSLIGSDIDPSVSVAALKFFLETAKELQENESLWQHISTEHHELIRAYLASPTTDTLVKYNLAPQSQSNGLPPVETAEAAKPASVPLPAAAPSPKEAEKPKPQPVLEKVQISKSAQFTLDLDKLMVEALPASEIALPPGISPTLLPSHITADPTPFLPSRQVSRTSVEAQVQAQRQSQLMITVQSWIATLKGSDVSRSLDTLQQIFHGFSNDFRAFIFHIEPLLNTMIGQIKIYFDVMTAPVDQPASSMRTALLTAVGVIFVDENSAQHVPESLLKALLLVLLDAMIASQSLQIPHEDSQILVRTANSHIVNSLINANRSARWIALLSLLRERTTKDPASGTIAPGNSVLDVTRKCVLRITKPLSANMPKIVVSAVLYEIHLFFVAHPPHLWPRLADSVLEVVKAALEKFVEVLGSSIVNYLGSIPQHLPPPVINYYVKAFLMKHVPNMDPALLQSIAAHDVNPETQPATLNELNESIGEQLAAATPKVNAPVAEYRLPSPATDGNKQQALRHVFQKISKKETTQQGLVDLYWLQKDHADLDVDAFLQPTSSAFKAFIYDQLKRIAALDTVTSSSPAELEYVAKDTLPNALQPAQHANAQLSRLRSLQSKLKLGKPSDGIVAVELDPSVLASMVSAGPSVGTGTAAIAGGQSNLASLSGSAASVSGFRERLRKAASSTEPLNSKFELPSLTMPASTPSAPGAASSSFALPTLNSEISVSAARPTPTPTTAPAPSDTTSHIPLGPSTAPGASSVDALRERLAKIKGKSGPSGGQ